MNRNYIGLQWKFFLVLFAISVVVLGILAFRSYNSGKQEVLLETQRYLEDVGRTLSFSINGDNIVSAYEQQSTLNVEYESATNQIRRFKQLFENNQNDFPIKHISVFTSDGNSVRIFFTTRTPFEFLEQRPAYPELQTARQQNTVTYRNTLKTMNGCFLLLPRFMMRTKN